MGTLRGGLRGGPLNGRGGKLLRAIAIEVVKYGERLARSGFHVDR